MARILLPVLVSALLLLAPASAPAIVGGEPATQDYPNMALFVYDADDDDDNDDYRFRCAGSLIRPDWVLTAAHCVYDDRNDDGDEEVVPPAKVRFVLGIRKRSEAATKGETLQAAEIRAHESYHTPSFFSSDVALVRLASSSTKGTPMRLANDAERGDWAPDKPARVIGWGGTFYPGVSGVNTPDELHEVDVPIVDDDECDLSYPSDYLLGDFEPLTMVCAGEQEGGKDACSGDSGGPLMVRNGAGAFVHVGVVSWGGGCAYPTQYGVYSRAADSFLKSWVERNLPAPSEPSAPPASEPLPAPDPTAPPAFPTQPAGGPQSPPDDITAIVKRVVLPGRRLRIACRLEGKSLRSCQVEVFVRRSRRAKLDRRFVLTIPAGGSQTVRIGRPRFVVLRGVLLAQDGSRYRVRRTLRRTT